MKVTDFIVDLLKYHGITHIFGYQGGMITHLVDSISKSSIQYIQCYHEQTAAFAAEGYARESGKFGVAISTSGPGATNLITGIANAYFDSIPVLYITGQVNTYEYKYSLKLKQKGFQETDIVSIVKPITKYVKLVDKIENVQYEIEKAIYIAMEGRKGPVVIDLPMDIQRSDYSFTSLNKNNFSSLFSIKKDEKNCIIEKLSLFSMAKRPLVLCGNGVASSKTAFEVQQFIDKNKLPFVVSLMGKGVLDETGENFVGMIGSYGNRCANIILSKSDKVLVLGSRLDLRQTGDITSENINKIHFIHVDIDEFELCDNPIKNRTTIHSSLTEIMPYLNNISLTISDNWNSFIHDMRVEFSQKRDVDLYANEKKPYLFLEKLHSQISKNVTYTADVGQNQMWAAQTLVLNKNQRFYTCGGLAPMGYSLSAAIGASFANRNKKIICLTGDGGFQIALQSLLLISQYKLNIVIIIFNNFSLGMITQFQSLYFNSNMAGTTKEGGYSTPKISFIAKAMSLKYKKLQKNEVNFNFLKNDEPIIIELILNEGTNVVPKLEYNKALYDMMPYMNENDIKRIKEF